MTELILALYPEDGDSGPFRNYIYLATKLDDVMSDGTALQQSAFKLRKKENKQIGHEDI